MLLNFILNLKVNHFFSPFDVSNFNVFYILLGIPVEPYCNVNFVNLQRRILADRINRNNRTIGKDLKKDLQIANGNLNVPPVQDWPPPDLLGVRLLREPLGEGHRQAGVARGHPGAGAVNQSEHSIFIISQSQKSVV